MILILCDNINKGKQFRTAYFEHKYQCKIYELLNVNRTKIKEQLTKKSFTKVVVLCPARNLWMSFVRDLNTANNIVLYINQYPANYG